MAASELTSRRRFRALLVGCCVLAAGCSSSVDRQPESGGSVEDSVDAAGSDAGLTEEDGAATATTVVARGFTAEEQEVFDAVVAEFRQSRTVKNARAAVELMALSGEQRFAPWLIDLVQMGLSNLLNTEIIQVLAALTSIEPTGQSFTDFGRMGSFVDSQGIDPGEGYRDWKLALYERVDPGFTPLLDSVTDDDRFARIRFGGVRRGGIPELNDPPRISAAEALEWITDDEVVLGVDLDGQVIAYPFRIVGHHELVNDTVAGTPVSLVYCTLCRTGLLFDRRVDDQVLDFETSGLLINSNKIMVDRQTDTLWHHAAGLGIGGPLEGRTLDVYPLETTTWAEWYEEHPDTEVLDIPSPIFFDEPERPPIAYPYEASGPYGAYYDNPETWFPIRQVSDALETKSEVIGIRAGSEALAIAVADLADGPSRHFTVGERAYVAVPNSRGARVYAAGPEIPAALAGLPNGAAVDVASSDGETAVLAEDGSVLERVAVEQGFWFSWFDRNPTTELWPEP